MSDLLDPEDGNIINEPLSEALTKRYLAYALSTITSRALPDVRDGLKPVQRRIRTACGNLSSIRSPATANVRKSSAT